MNKTVTTPKYETAKPIFLKIETESNYPFEKCLKN